MSVPRIVVPAIAGLIAATPVTGNVAALASTPQVPVVAVAGHSRPPTAAEILIARPLRPTDLSLLTPAVYPASPPTVPASGSDLTDAQARALLVAYEHADQPGDAAGQQTALDFYDSSPAQAKIANNSLRAAAAALAGTWAAGAQYILTAAMTSGGHPLYTSVEFGDLGSSPGYAMVFGAGTSDPDQVKIVFNNRYRFENPFLFTSILAHEALHEDLQTANIEEAVNTSLDNLFAIGQFARHPGLLRLGTEMSRRLAVRTLERLNSGTGATLSLYADNGGRQVYPGSTVATERSWWDYADDGSRTTTPGNALLASYLKEIHHGGGSPCSGAVFNKALLDCINAEGNAGLSAAEIVTVARAMKLDTNIAERRSLRVSVKHGRLAGRLTSTAAACRARQAVTLLKLRHGHDQKIGRTRTTASGRFGLKLAKAKGTYLAAVKRRAVPGVGVCLATTSPRANA